MFCVWQVKWESLRRPNWVKYKQVEILDDKAAPSEHDLMDGDFLSDEDESDTEEIQNFGSGIYIIYSLMIVLFTLQINSSHIFR